jgi:hypothetical protein
MRYVRPKSLTWWAGVILIAMGVLQAAGLPSAWEAGAQGLTGVLAALTGVLAALTGAGGEYASPGSLIATGVGMIGLRDALVRNEAEAEDRMAYTLQAMQMAEWTVGGEDAVPPDEDEWPMPEGESPLPPDVRDPYGPGGSRS